MRNIVQENKVLQLIAPVIQTTTTTGSAVDVEGYNDDAMVIVNAGAITGGTPSTVVTLVGSLLATPTVYDQVLTTFVAFTVGGKVGAGKATLKGIKNVKGVATQTGAGNVPISITLVATPFVQGETLNSLTLA
jgi:hypothetical protein